MSDIGAVKLSVIVPVYNVEKHLKNCIDSLICSRSDAYEILLIDDGSTDGSGALCDELAESPCVRVIRQENAGLAAARNTGLGNARGSYVCFVDSDDHVERDFIDAAIGYAAGDDMICFPYYVDDEQTGVQRQKTLTAVQSVSAGEAVPALERAGVMNMAWNKLYRRAFLEAEPRSLFEPGTEPGEDLIFNAGCYLKAQRITLVDRAFYHWVRRGEDTLANRYRSDLIDKNKLFVNARCRLYEGLGIAQSQAALLANGNLGYVFGCVPNMYRKGRWFKRKERMAFYNEILHSERIAAWIAQSDTDSTLIRQFKRLYGTKSAGLMDAYYAAAMWGRGAFDNLYQKTRKRMKP